MQNFRLNRLLYFVLIIILAGGCGGDPDSGIEGVEPVERNTKEVSGQVLDSSGKPIVGAKVEIHSDPIIVYTDSQGRYRVTIEQGAHHIKISVPIVSTDGSAILGEYILFEKDFNTEPATPDDLLPEYIGDTETPLDNDFFEEGILCLKDSDGDGYSDVSGLAISVDSDSCTTEGYFELSSIISQFSDCDDMNNAINPGAAEVYDGVDNNCLDGIDENFSAYYADTDGDSYGAGTVVYYDAPTTGYVTNNGDCDDSDGSVNPGAAEVYDGIDNNCLNGIDENFSAYYADTDSDSYGAGTVVYFDAPTAGYATNGGDCDDTDGSVNPGAAEVYDGIDNNCLNGIDENFSAYYADTDGDSYGAGTVVYYDTPTAGYVTNNGDCDDTDDSVNPGAAEVYDGVDNNCLNGIDENFSAYYTDTDGDSYGAGTVVYYDAPTAGYVTNNGDCDDTDGTINPDAQEVADGVDNNCDGTEVISTHSATISPGATGVMELTQ